MLVRSSVVLGDILEKKSVSRDDSGSVEAMQARPGW
jgi:hypothetical protein